MRTVDPDVWLRTSAPEAWSRQRTDADSEMRLRRSFRDAALEFWTHASLRGGLFDSRRCITTCDTIRNSIVVAGSFVLTIALVTYNVQQQLSRPPIQVNALSSNSVIELRFPAVALCTNNVISKASLQQYIRFLLSGRAHNRTYGTDFLIKNILNFGAFVTKTLPQVDVLFMDLLQRKDPHFNVSEFMFQLSPKCSELLKACAWEGSLVNCSQLFAARITPLGFCCVFNSRYQPEDLQTAPWESYQVGQSTGLIVMYTEDDEDSAYVRRPALGVEVLLFDGDEYPLLETGVAHLYPVQRNASMFFSLTQRDIRASDDLESYTESWRQCRIRDVHGPRTARSSYGWCLLECRRRTIAALCNCVPFTLMPDSGDVICTPNHLPCLYKHKEKFIYHYPGENAGPGLTQEIQDSLSCEECLPDCGRPVYSADVASSLFSFADESKLILGLTLLPGVTLANSSVLRFYYNSNHQPMFVVEPALRWYEGIASIACHWVLLLTMTLVTFVELAFHITVRLVHHFTRRTTLIRKQLKKKSSSTSSKADKSMDGVSVTKEQSTEIVNVDILDPPVKRFYF